MKTYYAELDTSFETTQAMRAAGPCGDREGGIDLHRFYSKKERDEFVESHADCNEISAENAKMYHKDQFFYWANN